MEGHRKSARDEVLTFRSGFEVGLAAAILRIHWLAEARGLDVDGAMAEKRAFNATRADHQIERRRQQDGKKY